MANITKENISITPGNFELSGGVITAISGYPVGGTGSIIESPYHGDTETINVDQNTKIISISNKYKSKIDNIPTKVSDLTDSASYPKKIYVDETFQTKEDMDDYYTKADALTSIQDLQDQIDNKQNKLGFGLTTGNEISSIGLYKDGQIVNTTAIYTGEGGGESYSAGTDLKIENNIISVDTNGNPNNTASNTRNFVEGSWTVASGYMNHAEGVATSALGYGVHAQGMWTQFSSNDGQLVGGGTGPIYWGAGAGATVEGYCNATTSCPMSGTEGQSDSGPIHGGVLKVIGNGYVENVEHETDIHEFHPSDALIIFRDGTISAFGDIYKNGKKFITEGDFAQGNAYAMTTTGWEAIQAGGQGIQQVLHDDTLTGNGADNDNKLGVDTSVIQPVSGMTAYATTVLLDNVSGELKEQINTKLDKTFSSNFYPMNTNPSGYLTEHQSLTNYYTKSETSGAAQISAALAALPGGGITEVTHDTTLTGKGNSTQELGVAWSTLSSNKIDSAKSANSAEYITNGTGYSGFDDISAKFDSLTSYVPYSATELPIGTNNTATTNAAAIGGANSAIDLSFALGNGNSAKTTGCAIGEHNYAYNKSVAIGYQNTADYNVDIAIGYQCSSHDHAATFMDCNTAKNYSFAAGHANTAENYSFLLGRGLKFSGDISNGNGTALGSFVIGGWNNTTAGNALFVVGNGSSPSNKSDAFIVYRNGSINAGGVGSNTVIGTYSFVEGRNNIEYAGNTNHLEGGYNHVSAISNDAGYIHAEGEANEVTGHSIHIEGAYNKFYSDSTANRGISIEGYANATTANDTSVHGGIIKVIGNGTRHSSSNIDRSDAYILYRDGTVSAKQYKAEGYTQNNTYVEASVPKSLPNSGDNTMVVQKMFVCTSDNDIISHSNGLSNGEGCIFFRVG